MKPVMSEFRHTHNRAGSSDNLLLSEGYFNFPPLNIEYLIHLRVIM